MTLLQPLLSSRPAYYADSVISAFHSCRTQNRKRTMIRNMCFFVPLLFLFIGPAAAGKQGDFGAFTACIKNGSLRLDCSYGVCSESPNYTCEFMDSNGTLLLREGNEKCKLVLPGSRHEHEDETYTCILTRRMRRETKSITIKTTGKPKLKDCPSTSGLPLHETPAFFWPAVTLPLWRALVTDRHLT